MKQSARTTILTLWGALVTALALSLSITAPAVALDPGGREEALPTTPPPDPSVPSVGTTVLSDGTPVGIVVAGGNGGLLHVVDLSTRTLRSRERLVPENTDVQPWEFATLSNRHVMLASGGGQLFEIDPDAPEGQKATNLSDPSRPGYEQVAAYSTFLWDVAVDEHDRVYVATQSNHGGHILRYDPSANQGRGQWTDLLPGGVQAGESDVRSLAYDNGFLYAGTGTKNPSIVRINTSTNAATKLAVPSHVTAGLSHLERLQVKAGNLYVGTNVPGGVRPTCGGTCVLDPATGAQKMKDGKTLEVDTWSSQVVTRPGEAEKVYYTVQSHNTPTLQEYDPRTNTSRTLAQGLASTARPSQSSWATHEHFISAGKDDASIAIVHASDGSATGLPKDANGGNAIQGSPRDIQSLTAVPGGDLYASWYMTAPMLLRATPNAQVDKTQYSLPQAPLGQVEGFGHSSKWFVTGIYPSGELVRYEMGASGPTLENHQSVRITSDARQARPYAIVPINDDEFAVGTSPKNKAGSGALSIYDAAHNKIDTYPLDTINYADPSLRGLLSDRRPLSIVHHQDKLYVGTSASGNGMNFVERALGMMEKGYAAIIIQNSAGSGKAREINRRILQNNTLLASIKMPLDLFIGKSSVQTNIYVFKVGEKHKAKSTVKFIDFSDDGYTRTNRKKASTNLKDTGNARGRYEELVNLVEFGRDELNIFSEKEYYEGKINPENGADWNQTAPIDTKPTLDDFKKTVSDYLAWEVSNLLKRGNGQDDELGK